MPPSADPHVQLFDTGHREWTNKHETFTQPLAGLYDLWNPPDGDLLARYGATTREMMALIDAAARDGVRLRALGGGWSLSAAAATDGRLVNTKPLNLFFRVTGDLVEPAYDGDRDGLRFLQCGCSIVEINQRLRAEGRSLRTTGASNGQTIAGAMSTGTHGAAIDVGAIQDYVVGLHLVVGPARHVWLERASRPVLVGGFAERLGAERLRSDDLFYAALVGFGSFGFVHGVLIETDPLFLIEMHRHRAPFDGALRRVMSTLDFTGFPLPGAGGRPYHFELLFNPYDLAPGAYVTAMYRQPFRSDYTPPPGLPEGLGPGDDAMGFMGKITDLLPAAVPALVTTLVRASYTMDPVVGTIGEIFSSTTTRGKVASTAIAMPVERAPEAVDLVLGLNGADQPFAGVVSLRYVKGTRATLGFTRFPATCVLEADGPQSDNTASFHQRIWTAFRDRAIPHTFHWGKMLPPGAPALSAYGDAAVRWKAAREALLDASTREVFSNEYMHEHGLAS